MELDVYRKEDSCLKDTFYDCLSMAETSALTKGESREDSGISNCQYLASLSEKYSKEQEKAFVLEDRVKELEQVIQDMSENQAAFAKEATKRQEWLSAMLEREREINEKLSNRIPTVL